MRAGLKAERTFTVGMYGRETLAQYNPPNMTPESPINQLPSELRIIHEKLQLLKAEAAEA
jgi:hypothetical protein